jgi:hypothetical protein
LIRKEINKAQENILNGKFRDIYHDLFLGADVWYFKTYGNGNPYKEYDIFKRLLSDKLNIHFNNIAIVGSAKNGFSLSPKKYFREFDEEKSDIDVVLVSDVNYKILWEAYLNMYYKQIPFPEYKSTAKSVFKGYLSIDDDSTLKHRDLIDWKKNANDMIKDVQLELGMMHSLKYRVYDSWESVEKYHYFNIKQLRSRIIGVQKKEKEIIKLMELLQSPIKDLILNLKTAIK